MFACPYNTNSKIYKRWEAYYEKNSKKIVELASIKDEMLFKEYYDLHSELPANEMPIIHHLAIVVRNIWSMAGPFHGVNS